MLCTKADWAIALLLHSALGFDIGFCAQSRLSTPHGMVVGLSDCHRSRHNLMHPSTLHITFFLWQSTQVFGSDSPSIAEATIVRSESWDDVRRSRHFGKVPEHSLATIFQAHFC